jgi:predicted metal-dependent phosphoesterase TrpH
VRQGAYRFSTGNIISRAHFARFLVEQGYAKDVAAVFKRYLVKGKPGFVNHQWASLETALQWIHQAGGVAVMAHPGRYDMGKKLLHQLIQEFIQYGGRGIEVVTGSHRPEQFRTFADIAQKYQLLSSMGSDYHGKGMSFVGMGQLPSLPAHCVPVWQDWPEFAELQ